MVESGNMNDTKLVTYSSSVLSLRSMGTVVLLAELNDIEIHTGDIRNAYLIARTTEEIVFKSGPEFSPFGHSWQFILINKSLYALKFSGARFHSHLSDTLTSLGFFPFMGGCNVWMCDEGNYFS